MHRFIIKHCTTTVKKNHQTSVSEIFCPVFFPPCTTYRYIFVKYIVEKKVKSHSVWFYEECRGFRNSDLSSKMMTIFLCPCALLQLIIHYWIASDASFCLSFRYVSQECDLNFILNFSVLSIMQRKKCSTCKRT